MKRIIVLILLVFVSGISFSAFIEKEPREYIFSLLSDTSLVWERDDNNCYIWDIIITYPKKVKVLETKIVPGNKYNDTDTMVYYRGVNHTLDVWINGLEFRTFYHSFDYIIK